MKKIYLLLSILLLNQVFLAMEGPRKKVKTVTANQDSNILSLTYLAAQALIKSDFLNYLSSQEFKESGVVIPSGIIELIKSYIKEPVKLDTLKKTLLHKAENRFQVERLLNFISLITEIDSQKQKEALKEIKELASLVINAKDVYGNTPLADMLFLGKKDAANSLLDYAIKNNIILCLGQNHLGKTALDYALILKDENILDKLDKLGLFLKQFEHDYTEAKWQNVDMFDLATEAGPDILEKTLNNIDEQISQEGLNKLLLVACCRQPNSIEFLLKNGADVNASDSEENKTALMIACQYQPNLEVINFLLDNGANINATDDQNTTALMYAFLNPNCLEVVKLLIDRGADTRAININGWSLLMVACNFQCNSDVIKLLLDNGIDINIASAFGDTALLIACQNENNHEIIKLLIDNNASINVNNNHGSTTLMFVCQYQKDLETIKLVINQTENINTSTHMGYTALFFACQAQSNAEIIKLLLDNGADARHVSAQTGRTALFSACQNTQNTKEIVKLLIDNGADVNAVDNIGFTPLMFLVFEHNRNLDIINLLITYQANINVTTVEGSTALMFACDRVFSSNDLEVVKILLNNGANVRHIDAKGQTALDMAKITDSSQEVIQLLENSLENSNKEF